MLPPTKNSKRHSHFTCRIESTENVDTYHIDTDGDTPFFCATDGLKWKTRKPVSGTD